MNHTQEIKSLLTILNDHGFTVKLVNDGEENVICHSRDEIVDIIESVDESWITVSDEQNNFVLFLVLGNDFGELVCDYTANDKLELAIDEYSELWSN